MDVRSHDSVRWEKRDEPQLNESIVRLKQINESALKSNPLTFFRQEADIAVVAHLLQLKQVGEASIKRTIVRKAFDNLWTRTSHDVEELAKLIEIEIQSYRSGPFVEWKIIFPFNFSRKSLKQKRWFTAFDLRLHVASWSELSRKVALQNWREEVKSHYPRDEIIFGSSFIPLIAKVRVRDEDEAFRRAERSFDLLRAAINWPLTINRFHPNFSGRHRPIATIPPPPNYGVFYEDGTFKSLFFNEHPPENYRRFDISSQHLSKVERLLSYFKGQTKETFTKEKIADAFLWFGDALGSVNPRDAFLRLWQILDLIAHSPGGEAYNIRLVRDRVSVLLGNDKLMKALLNLSYDKRNTLVHTGKFDGNQMDVNYLKAVVEIVVLKLMSHEKTCPTWNKLLFYYSNASSGPNEIAEKMAVLKAIRRETKKGP